MFNVHPVACRTMHTENYFFCTLLVPPTYTTLHRGLYMCAHSPRLFFKICSTNCVQKKRTTFCGFHFSARHLILTPSYILKNTPQLLGSFSSRQNCSHHWIYRCCGCSFFLFRLCFLQHFPLLNCSK